MMCVAAEKLLYCINGKLYQMESESGKKGPLEMAIIGI